MIAGDVVETERDLGCAGELEGDPCVGFDRVRVILAKLHAARRCALFDAAARLDVDDDVEETVESVVTRFERNDPAGGVGTRGGRVDLDVGVSLEVELRDDLGAAGGTDDQVDVGWTEL